MGSGARLALFAAPLSAVVVVVLGILSGGERPVQSVRVYGGPTEGQSVLALRLELFERLRLSEVPLARQPFRIRVRAGGRVLATGDGRSDELGLAEVRLALTAPTSDVLELEIAGADAADARPLARGLLRFTREQYRRDLVRGGGFVNGARTSPWSVRVAPLHGALLMSGAALSSALVVAIERDARGVPEVRVRLRAEGTADAPELTSVTDARGRVRFDVHPIEPRLRLRIDAESPNGEKARAEATLVTAPGAIRARRAGGRLLLEASGAADRAFVGFFDEEGRRGGLHAPLALADGGKLTADVPLPPGLPEPIWAVTSSQPDLASPSALGWQLVEAPLEPLPTLTVRERLLLDGAPLKVAAEAKRARRVRLVVAAYALVALSVTLALFLRRVRESEERMSRHLARAGAARQDAIIQPRRSAAVFGAASIIFLGFLILALLAVLKD